LGALNEGDVLAGSVARGCCRVETSCLGEARTRLRSKARRHNYRILGVREKLRIISNVGLIVGQCLLLFVSRDVGLIVIISSSVLSVPFFLRIRMWDVLMLMGFMFVVNVVGLFVQ